jgi:hypothetical protein
MSRHPFLPKWVTALVILSALVMGVAILIRTYASPFFADLGIPFGIAHSVLAACVLLGLVASVSGGSAALVVCVRRLVRAGM